MTSASEEQYPGEPFRLGKPNVAGKIVEMPDKRGHDLLDPGIRSRGYAAQRFVRSEEHTSELQSLMRISYAVFCLKKKKSSKTVRANHVVTLNALYKNCIPLR